MFATLNPGKALTLVMLLFVLAQATMVSIHAHAAHSEGKLSLQQSDDAHSSPSPTGSFAHECPAHCTGSIGCTTILALLTDNRLGFAQGEAVSLRFHPSEEGAPEDPYLAQLKRPPKP